ncbi:hypothetical protein ACI2KH_23720 [Roseomonas mucosa]|jgi:hypothetical protein|uniref:hypothetical protein n=1 Tax=Roseomonas mucosa TaxID=207340 RepID=UPI003850E642
MEWGYEMLRAFASSVIFTFLTVFYLSVEVKAQSLFVGSIAAGIVGEKFLQNAQNKVTEIMSQAEQTGNALIARSASEAQLLIDNVSLNLTDQRNKTVRSINDETTRIWMHLAEVLDHLDEQANRAYEVRDATVVDVQDILATFPFVDKITSIVAVRGLTIPHQNTEHTIIVTGTGLGPANDSVASTLDFELNGKPVVPIRQNRRGNNSSEIVFSPDQLEEFFDKNDQKILFTALKIKLTAKRPRTWKIWRDTQNSEITSSVWLSFFPRKAGEVSITVQTKEFGWKPENQTIVSDAYDSPDCGENKCNVPWQTNPILVQGGNVPNPVEGSRRITGGTCSCQPLWGSDSCAAWHTKTFIISQEGRAAVCLGRHWTEINRYQAIATVENYVQTKIVQKDENTQEIYFGTPVDFNLPRDYVGYTVKFKSITNQVENHVRGEISGLYRVSEVDQGINRLIVISASPPTSVAEH